ncbi:histidinol dehydrogenase [Chloroflexota bacterium]
MKEGIKQLYGEDLTLEQVVVHIIDDVRRQGDKALYKLTEKIDGVKLSGLEVTNDEIAAAYDVIDDELLGALELAAERIQAFHEVQKANSRTDFMDDELGQLVFPLERVGLYAPGGRASYPSTVMMTAIPAKVAEVKELILATPPAKDGSVDAAVLVAADIAGVDKIYKVGGAQAVAAMAYGTESIPKVDKVCGPGNIFVTLAKKSVYGAVDIDGIQGPTETIVLADESANPLFCALDLLAQAEHDVAASAIMITDSKELAENVVQEIKKQLVTLERAEIAEEAIERHGAVIVVDNIDDAIELANIYAPEHLCLTVRQPDYYLSRITNSGGIFIGESSPEGVGDYVAGPSHVMPTSGTARWSSPLSVNDFLRTSNVVAIKEHSLREIGPAAAIIARAEGFTAHAKAVEERLKKLEGDSE